MAEVWRNRLGKAYSHAVLRSYDDGFHYMRCGEVVHERTLADCETAPKRCPSCQVAIGVERRRDD